MALNTSSTAIVIIKVDASGAIHGAREAGGALGEMDDRVARTSKNMGTLARTMNTVTKALISMVGVLIAYNVLVTIPEKIISGIAAVLSYAVKSFNDMEQATLSLKALLASTVKFSEDAGQNYIMAGEMAIAVNRRLIDEAARTQASFEQMQQGWQAFVGAGGLQFAKTWDEALKLNSLLVSSILQLTTGMDASRQIATEIRAILSGQKLEGSQLAIAMGLTKKELKEILEEAKKNKNLYEVMSKILSGQSAAMIEFSQTLTGIATTIKDMVDIFVRQFIGPVVKFVKGELLKFKNLWDSSKDTVITITATIGGVLLAYAELLFGYFNSLAKDSLPKIADWVLEIAVTLYRWYMQISNVFTELKLVWHIIDAVGTTLQESFKILDLIFRAAIAFLKGDWKQAFALDDERARLAAQQNKDVKARVDNIMKEIDGIRTGNALYNVEKEEAKFRNKILEHKMKIANDIMETQKKDNNLLNQGIILQKTRNEEDEKGAKKRKEAVDSLEQFMDSLRKKSDDPWTKLGANLVDLYHKARREWGDFPDLLKKAIASIQKYTIQETGEIAKKGLEDVEKWATQNLAKGTRAALDILGDQVEAAAKKVRDAQKAMDTWFSQFNLHVAERALMFRQTADIARNLERATKGRLSGDERRAAREQAQSQLFQLRHGGPGDIFGPETRLNLDRQKLQKELDALRAQGYEETDPEVQKLTLHLEKNKEQTEELIGWIDTLEGSLLNVWYTTQNVDGAWVSLTRRFTDVEETGRHANQTLVDMSVIFGNMLADIVSGEKTIGQAIKGIAGQFIQLVGTMLVAVGVAALLGDQLGGVFGKLVGSSTAKALIAIAAGYALIGLGKRLQGAGGGGGGGETSVGGVAGGAGGGGGGKAAPTYHAQGDIMTQQNAARATQQNIDALHNLNGQLDRLSKEKGDVLVARTITQNPRIVTKSVTSVASKSYATSQELGGAILGEPA